MKKSFEFFIARRYLGSRRSTGFINLITYISILGVTIGVAALIITLSVMNGFEEEVRSRIIGFDTHVRLRKYHFEPLTDYNQIMSQIQDIPHIEGLSPFILDKGMIRYGQRSDGIIIRGSDPNTIRDVSNLEETILLGSLELGMFPATDGQEFPGIVVGRWLADRLLLDVGEKVLLISLAGVHSMFKAPPMKQFVVTGFFETGMYEYDNAYAYISLKSAQELFKMENSATGLEIRLDDLYKADAVVEKIENRLGFPYCAETWFDLRKNLFSWMQLEKWAMFIVLSLIIMVAAFNIISTLIMVVMEKTKEIGILKSMGATSKSITRIFLFEGIVVGTVGALVGSGIGFLLCWAQLKYKFFSLPGDVYFINFLPVKMEPLDFILVGVSAFVICLLAAVYPAKRASNLVPVEAIRYE